MNELKDKLEEFFLKVLEENIADDIYILL